MRRDISDYKSLIRIVLFVTLIVYQVLTSINHYLTPLFGVVMTYIILNFNKNRKFSLFLAFTYIFLFEINHGFIPLSSLVLFFFLYKLMVTISKENKYNDFTIVSFCIALSYIGYFLLNIFLQSTFGIETASLSWFYALYIFVDIVIAFIVLL
jgi:hypothetical protein